MTKKEQEIINKFVIEVSKNSIFVAEQMLPDDIVLSDAKTGSVSMVPVMKIIKEWNIAKEALEKLEDK